MKQILLLMTLFAFSKAQEVPYLSGRVNDYAGILSSETIASLEAKLKDHEQRTSNQVALLTIASLEGEVLEEYSIRVAETWKLGQKDKDNGVLLLIARDDRKLRIEVGDGLEGTLTDATCSQIIRHEIVPRFKSGDYEGGVTAGVDAILGVIEGTYVADASSEESAEGFESLEEKIVGFAIFIVVVGIFTLIALVSPGGTGWFLYVFLIPFWLAFPWAILGTLVPGVLYIILMPILKIFFRKNARIEKWSKTWISTGGSRGWSSGGWSSGGGGFSGGGGSFSGGGSSGSW